MAGSTDLITYLNYISNWEDESDENIDKLITEQSLFTKVGDFESDSVVETEFTTLIDLAKDVRDRTIAADATQIAADAAAVASIWSFGLGMAAFITLEAAAITERAFISSKSKDFHEKLTTIDTDISSHINNEVKDYIAAYKANNDLITAQAPKGMDLKESRSILMQFMSQVERNYEGKGGLDAKNFKELAGSARIAYKSDEINKVYDALDKLNFGDKSKQDVQDFMNTLAGLRDADHWIQLVQNVSFGLLAYKMKIANDTITECCKAANLPVEEVDSSAFGMMDACGKFAAGVTVLISVVDAILEVIDIVDVVEQTAKMCDQLQEIDPQYKSYFNGIKSASKAYNDAISDHTDHHTHVEAVPIAGEDAIDYSNSAV